jgi:hypothetical protein
MSSLPRWLIVLFVGWPLASAFAQTPVPAPDAPGIRFEDRQAASNIDFVLDNATTPDKPIIDSMLGGLAVFDFDNDGLLDLYFTNGASIPSLEKDAPQFWNRLYRNQGDGRFKDVTEKAGVRGEGYSMGVATGDFDNDGWTDLYVTGVNRNILYRNLGKGRFADVTESAGVTGVFNGKKLWSVGAAWLDYDNDGDLDLAASRASGCPARRPTTTRCPTSSTATRAMGSSSTYQPPQESRNTWATA